MAEVMEMRLEAVPLPVEDVDTSKAFYIERVGFMLDHDVEPGNGMRVVQLTPPGSACSISIGIGITQAVPGSVQGLHLVVTDIEAAHAELVDRGVAAGEIFHFESGQQAPGPDPERRDYGSFLGFSDPDGNSWVVQEVKHSAPRA